MNRNIILLILFIIIATVFTSGCETKTANQTWGEKKIDLTQLKVADNTTSDHYEENGTTYFYVEGYLANTNPYDALDVKLKGTFFDSQGIIVAVNDTPFLENKGIPTNGNSYFYFIVADPERKIVNYKIDIISAKAQYG